jgi:hypothetical protein
MMPATKNPRLLELTRRSLFATALAPLAAAADRPVVDIALPYNEAERATESWANDEQKVSDWVREGPEAERCTLAFAAVELKRFLERTAPGIDVRFASTLAPGRPAILVGTVDAVHNFYHLDIPALPDRQAYEIRTLRRDGSPLLLLAGGGRQGALYAVYDYLARLGWRWYAPGAAGEVAAPERSTLPLDGWDFQTKPDFPLFRGFHAEYQSMESVEMFLWMARNRLNMWALRPGSDALMRKLGFVFLSGGHILEQILNADQRLPGGKTLFEEHPDWFAEIGGKRERKNASSYQFCVSNDVATHYVAQRIVEHFRSDWSQTDYQNVWMFDTWAGWCQCANCQRLGNDSDRYLHFLARVREELNRAIAAGTVSRNIGMVMVAYEGTPSLFGPSRGVPPVLQHGSDFVLIAPINRCYAHRLESRECSEFNEHYEKALASWTAVAAEMPIAVVEYYNVSKFEDLPLGFSNTMGADFAHYCDAGVKGISYMHIPMAVWGPRALTQALFARLAWNSRESAEKIREEFLRLYYGPAAKPMDDFYRALGAAYENITAWRSWAKESVNAGLLGWKGDRPERPLFPFKHLQLDSTVGGPGRDLAIGPAASLGKLREARAALEKALALHAPPPVRRRIEEDARLFRYGDESFRFYLEMARLYEARRLGRDEEAHKAWTAARRLADSLQSYYVPFDYESPGAGIGAKDALTRTQLRPLLEKLGESGMR